MAIQNPLKEGTNAAGGFLVPDEAADLLIKGVLNESAALSMAGNVQTTSSKKVTFPVLTDVPVASFVAEAGAKPTSGAEFGQVAVNVKKLAVIIPFTDELLEDAAIDPRLLVDAPVREAFAKTIDRHILGFDGAAALATSFDNRLYDTTQTADLGTTGDALRLAVSDAMADVEANGYSPNGLILPSDVRKHLRDKRKAVETTDPVYGDMADPFYGLRTAYSSNLYPIGSAEADGKMVGVVGDFSQLIVRIRSDIQVTASNQATVTIGGNAVNLWESNMTALRFEMRLGVIAHDVSRAFSKITNEDNA